MNEYFPDSAGNLLLYVYMYQIRLLRFVAEAFVGYIGQLKS